MMVFDFKVIFRHVSVFIASVKFDKKCSFSSSPTSLIKKQLPIALRPRNSAAVYCIH